MIDSLLIKFLRKIALQSNVSFFPDRTKRDLKKVFFLNFSKRKLKHREKEIREWELCFGIDEA
jgi:hypothetical protein